MLAGWGVRCAVEMLQDGKQSVGPEVVWGKEGGGSRLQLTACRTWYGLACGGVQTRYHQQK